VCASVSARTFARPGSRPITGKLRAKASHCGFRRRCGARVVFLPAKRQRILLSERSLVLRPVNYSHSRSSSASLSNDVGFRPLASSASFFASAHPLPITIITLPRRAMRLVLAKPENHARSHRSIDSRCFAKRIRKTCSVRVEFRETGIERSATSLRFRRALKMIRANLRLRNGGTTSGSFSFLDREGIASPRPPLTSFLPA